MGYYSDVAIALATKHKSKMLDIIREDEWDFVVDYPEETYDHTEDVRLAFTLFIAKNWKWYEGYDFVDDVMGLLREISNKEYGFLRIGEEDDDVETDGDYGEYELGVSKDLVLPVPPRLDNKESKPTCIYCGSKNTYFYRQCFDKNVKGKNKYKCFSCKETFITKEVK